MGAGVHCWALARVLNNRRAMTGISIVTELMEGLRVRNVGGELGRMDGECGGWLGW